MPRTPAVYQIRITLQDIQPPIWRRIQVWEDITLAQLHTILQTVMDWEDYHLHQFLIGKRIYSVPGPDDDLYEFTIIDESRERLSDVVPRVGTTFTYLYDFGDNWRHDLLLEAITMPEAPGHYPQCIAGERRTPPEDVGGGSGYERYLEALGDPDDDEHEDMLHWRGPFDPDIFPIESVNDKLHRKFRRRKSATAPPSSEN